MTAVRSRVRESEVRPTVHAAPRESRALGHGEAIGRDGQVIRRVRVSDDKYAVPPEIVEQLRRDGWVYQWNVFTVKGQEDRSEHAALARAGWTPVPAERHPGVFVPAGETGPIVIGGLMLMERPLALEMEAKAEDHQAAVGAVNGSRQQFGFKTKVAGFEGADVSNNPAVRNNSFVKTELSEISVPRPKYEMSVD